MPSSAFLSSAEAAYVAGLGESAINMAVDEQIVAAPLIRPGPVWRISRLAAAFISFYVKTEQVSPARVKKAMLESSLAHIQSAGKLERALALRLPSQDKYFDLLLAQHIHAATIRSRKLIQARRAIRAAQDTMWGMPVFRGTRVLAETIVGSIEDGTSLAQLKESYPFLTEDLVESAQIYMQIHPIQRTARLLAETHPDWKINSLKVIRLPEYELAPLP